MKTNISKSKMTRAGAIILAVITLLSTIFIIPANAATGDPATITFDYAYDTGGNIITYYGTVTHNGITVGTPGEELCRIYADGKDAYCIQPGYSLYSGNTLIEGKSSVWDGVSKDKQKAVNIALLYGKPGNAKNLGYTESTLMLTVTKRITQKWILFFVKIGSAYFDYRKHGQFEFTAPAILFACLIFTITAPLYIWSVI